MSDKEFEKSLRSVLTEFYSEDDSSISPPSHEQLKMQARSRKAKTLNMSVPWFAVSFPRVAIAAACIIFLSFAYNTVLSVNDVSQPKIASSPSFNLSLDQAVFETEGLIPPDSFQVETTDFLLPKSSRPSFELLDQL